MNTDRIQSIDGLRGFSLLGILIANMLSFQYDSSFQAPLKDATVMDEFAYYFTKIFFEGTFYPLFSFIFGYSLVQLVASIHRHNRHPYPALIRRAIGLIVIGLIHYIFVWDGDIIYGYGITLLALLFCIKANPRIRMIIALVTVFFTVMITGLSYAFSDLDTESRATLATLEALQHGTYLDVLNNRLEFNLTDLPLPYALAVIIFLISMSFQVVAILPFALFGMNAAERGDFKDQQVPVARRRFHWIYFIIIGLLLKSLILLDFALGGFLFVVGGYVLTFGYINLFIWLYAKLFHDKLRNFFASLGKLSLSNYLMQSIVCTTIFYGYGLKQFGELGVAIGVLIALALYIIQGLISYWYVNYVKQGPVEFILRQWTYLGRKRQGAANIEQQRQM